MHTHSHQEELLVFVQPRLSPGMFLAVGRRVGDGGGRGGVALGHGLLFVVGGGGSSHGGGAGGAGPGATVVVDATKLSRPLLLALVPWPGDGRRRARGRPTVGNKGRRNEGRRGGGGCLFGFGL